MPGVPAGASEHKSVNCAVIYAELAYLAHGAGKQAQIERLLQDNKGLWHDPQDDVIGEDDPEVWPLDQVKSCSLLVALKRSVWIPHRPSCSSGTFVHLALANFADSLQDRTK